MVEPVDTEETKREERSATSSSSAAAMDRSLLDQFWKLSENKDATRVDAAIKILLYLKKNELVSSHLWKQSEVGPV